MTALTDFGDPAVLLPLAAILLLWLLRLPTKSAAAWWLAAVVAGVGGTALLKIYFYGCPLDARLHNPSGHVSLSTLVYGGYATIFAARAKSWQRAAMIGAAAALVLGIAASRIILDFHTTIEVAFGLVIGGLSLAAFASRYWRRPSGNLPLGFLLLASLAIILVLHGDSLRAEEFLHRVSAYAQLTPIACL